MKCIRTKEGRVELHYGNGICDVQVDAALIEYKKIEDELGFDLITLFKALKNGIYYRYLNIDGT